MFGVCVMVVWWWGTRRLKDERIEGSAKDMKGIL